MNLPQIYLQSIHSLEFLWPAVMKCPSIAGGIETIQYSSSVSYTGVGSRTASGILFKCDYSSNCCRYCCSSEDSGYWAFHWGIYVCDWPHLTLSIVNWKRLNSGGAIQRNSLFRWNGQRTIEIHYYVIAYNVDCTNLRQNKVKRLLKKSSW